ncbi:MAG TPA: lytic murein transglycosylase, partial [Solirubrobacteraceae bacterium]|nr:lytic murein transglycosylase [Solirubrobacteraceae bacterium]
FRIPPFLLSIYQAAGIQYGVPWEVLAAINEIETDYGRNLNVSSAGALGWMQFMPASWQAYGVDANEDGRKDPYNPVDAIFAAARYLRAAGAASDLARAIFAYNHADWYVAEVLDRARRIAGLPSELVGSLTGLAQGRSPVAARARYARRAADARPRRGLRLVAPAGSPVVAVQDGEVVRVGRSTRLGRFVMLRDAYGNTYTYGHLAKVARSVLVAKERAPAAVAPPVTQPLQTPLPDPAPSGPASAGSDRPAAPAAGARAPAPTVPPAAAKLAKERLFAHPARARSLPSGGRRQILDATFALPAEASLRSYFAGRISLERDELELRRLYPGRRVIAGTILGRIGATSIAGAPHVLFEIRPPGTDMPRIDPEPFLEGWRALESTAIYRARGAAALAGGSIGQILLMSKDALARRVLADPAIAIYACGRRDIAAGVVDRRVLATLAFLSASGLRPTVSSLRCGHRTHTDGGNISHHASGNAVDIAKINGRPILGNQGEGSLADTTVRRLLTLQGALAPAQIISLMRYPGAANTLALADHADHIHVGFRPRGGAGGARGIPALGLRPAQWLRLVDRLGRIRNPAVARAPSRYAIRAAPGGPTLRPPP